MLSFSLLHILQARDQLISFAFWNKLKPPSYELCQAVTGRFLVNNFIIFLFAVFEFNYA